VFLQVSGSLHIEESDTSQPSIPQTHTYEDGHVDKGKGLVGQKRKRFEGLGVYLNPKKGTTSLNVSLT
jgi:hypothetical protein